jgi:hypothetical protein
MDDKHKAHIQRLAQGLPSLKRGEDPNAKKVASETANWLPAVEKHATRRLIKTR